MASCPCVSCSSSCSFNNPNFPSAGSCPKGYFCPHGTDEPKPCLIGTFNNKTHAKSINDCQPCPEGMYCNIIGASEPTGFCWPGFYCTANSTVPNQLACPAGMFCESGVHRPIACPSGTFRNITHGTKKSDCFNCTGGKYCKEEGLINPTGDCNPGCNINNFKNNNIFSKFLIK